MDYKSYFKGKKITVMGLGLLGRGVGDAEFLASCGADLIVTDLKSKKELDPSLKKLKRFKNIKYVLGGHRFQDFRNRDMILKAAGVPLNSQYIQHAKKKGIPVEMSASLFAKLSRLPVVGITGTRGKSTVTHMIAHGLKTAGIKFILGGNIVGISNLSLLPKAKNASIAVLELDSWQLQGFGDSKFSPHISVFTTFYPDHMNYYGNKMKHYFTDKAAIFKYQKKGDILIVGNQAFPFIKKMGGNFSSNVIKSSSKLPKGFSVSIPGEHNEYNASLAIDVLRALDLKDSIIKKALKSFNGVPGRLELLKEAGGVRYYNDTTATTPEATVAALKALGSKNSGGKKVILIMGGSDKGLDMTKLILVLEKFSKSVILLSGSGTEIVKPIISKFKVFAGEFSSLEDSLKKARELAKKGDIVLFSPAFASFGMFKNEFDRGEQFNKLVKKFK